MPDQCGKSAPPRSQQPWGFALLSISQRIQRSFFALKSLQILIWEKRDLWKLNRSPSKHTSTVCKQLLNLGGALEKSPILCRLWTYLRCSLQFFQYKVRLEKYIYIIIGSGSAMTKYVTLNRTKLIRIRHTANLSEIRPPFYAVLPKICNNM